MDTRFPLSWHLPLSPARGRVTGSWAQGKIQGASRMGQVNSAGCSQGAVF